jgi:hypothetical protein
MVRALGTFVPLGIALVRVGDRDPGSDMGFLLPHGMGRRSRR